MCANMCANIQEFTDTCPSCFLPLPPQFAQVLFALELFMLSPFVRRYVRCTSTPAHACSAVLLVALTAAGIAVISAGRCFRLA